MITKSWKSKMFKDVINKKNSLSPLLLSSRLFGDEPCFDVTVVGGGIVGVATARELSIRHKKLRIALLEKENRLAGHQSGHNSGVVHAGIYYKPGTLKAKLCVEGMKLAYSYFQENNVPYKKCGKLIVARNSQELKRLDDLYQRGLENEVPDLKIIDQNGIKDIEPYCRGLKALHSPHTGIVDWAKVTEYYAKDFRENGGKIFLNFKVTEFKEAAEASYSISNDYPVVIKSSYSKFVKSKYVLTCGGLHSDVLSEMSGCVKEPRIVPFRGEYLLLKSPKSKIISGNIYPVPDPRFPFLGVHFTPRMDGGVWLGPNAVFALKREGYQWTDVSFTELLDVFRYKGFHRLALKYLGFGSQEIFKSFAISLQVKELQTYVPEIKVSDVERGPTGVRAQAVDLEGNLVDDFVFDVGKFGIGKRILHCRNAPSPGATSSLAIANYIANKIETKFAF